MSTVSLYSILRQHSAVCCDTLDPSVGASLGPFVDCTSNQAIALGELRKESNSEIVGQAFETLQILRQRKRKDGSHIEAESTSADRVKSKGSEAFREDHGMAATAAEALAANPAAPDSVDFDKLDIAELSVQISTVLLALRMVPYLTGCVHVQTNPFHAYSTDKTVEDARRIVEIFRRLGEGGVASRATPVSDSDGPGTNTANGPIKSPIFMADGTPFSASRVVIKIPATWEGLQACRRLEAQGIRTLATTLFALEQAALAGEVGCSYVAPYVNELKVHIEAGYTDTAPNLTLPARAQLLYRSRGLSTRVLPASLVTVRQCLEMAGINYITIAPKLLYELSNTSTEQDMLRDILDLDDTTDSIVPMSGELADVNMFNDSMDLSCALNSVPNINGPLQTMPEVVQPFNPTVPATQSASPAPNLGYGLNSTPDFISSTGLSPGAGLRSTSSLGTPTSILLPSLPGGITTALDRAKAERPTSKRYLDDESGWRMAFTRSDNGKNEVKLVQAINIFCDMQMELEEMLMRRFLLKSYPTGKPTVAEQWKFVTANHWSAPSVSDMGRT